MFVFVNVERVVPACHSKNARLSSPSVIWLMQDMVVVCLTKRVGTRHITPNARIIRPKANLLIIPYDCVPLHRSARVRLVQTTKTNLLIILCDYRTSRFTSPTVISRAYHAAPADAGRLAVSLKAGPQACDTPAPHPAATAASYGPMRAEGGRRDTREVEDDAVEAVFAVVLIAPPERGGATSEASPASGHVCPEERYCSSRNSKRCST